MNLKLIAKSFVLQHDHSDCGVACLLSLSKYYGSYMSLERLRELSGTDKQGTSLLGLYQAANSIGFDAEGCEADVESLIQHGKPVILHVTINNQYNHYVICYGYEKGQFIIGDPALGITRWSKEILQKYWQSKSCLTLEINEKFTTTHQINKIKKGWIIKLINDDIKILTFCLILGIILAMLNLAMAVFSQKLIDDIIPKKDLNHLWIGVSLLGFLLLIQVGLSVLRQHLLLSQAKTFNNRIIDFFYSKLLLLPKSFFDNRKIGDMTARLNDTRRIQTIISQLLGSMAINILVVIISASFLFVYSWKIALIVFFTIPLFFFIIYRSNKKVIKGQKDVMAGYAQSESNFISTIQGVNTIKNFNKQQQFSELNKTIYGFFQDRVFSLGQINIRLGWQSSIVTVVLSSVILAFGGYMVVSETLRLGELMAISSIVGFLIPAVVSLAVISIPINEAKVAFDRMFEFAGIEPENRIGNVESNLHFDSLEIANLSFRFPGRKQILNDISLFIGKNEIISIAGESGCGKSTLCQIIEKFYDYEDGKIILNKNLSLAELTHESWRNIFGVVSQDIFIFNGTVMANISLEENSENVIDFCKKYGFDKYISELPQSYLTIIGEEGINLSGGQKQIIALARALYKKPELLILDEATSAMDRNTELFVLKLLVDLKDNMSIIFISHRLHILRDISDRVYIIDNGKIQDSGTHKELLNRKNSYTEYWNSLYSAFN